MKKILLSLILAIGVSQANVFSQTSCTGGASNCDLIGISNVVVQITNTNPISATQCEVTFNVSFDLSSNNGNKDIFIHSWLSADYPSYFPCTPGAQPAPTNTQLGMAVNQAGKSFLDIGLDNASAPRGGVGVTVNIPIKTSYSDDNTVVLTSPSNSPGMAAFKIFQGGTIDRVTINNSKVIINTACTSTIVVRTDVWSKNGTGGPAQCWIAGITQYFNDPSISGFRNCATPARQYTLGINTVDPVAKNVTYKVYIDMNDNGSLEPLTDELAFTSGTISISSSTGYSSGGFLTLPSPYSDTQPYSEKGYLILVEGTTLSNNVLKYFPAPSGCFILPADLISFNAIRNNSNVLLKWQTSNEQNNRGFAVERNNGNNVWREVAFIPTQAAGGNSSSLRSYQYIDANDSKFITQYRIRQVDIDNRSKYTQVRSIRGLDQSGGIIVYPNPTTDGKVNVVFEEANSIRNISLIDMSGRTLKQIVGISSNSIVLDNLNPGMYTLRVIVPATGEQTIQKIVVNKR